MNSVRVAMSFLGARPFLRIVLPLSAIGTAAVALTAKRSVEVTPNIKIYKLEWDHATVTSTVTTATQEQQTIPEATLEKSEQ